MNNLARVGAFVLIALGVIAFLILRIEHIPLGRKRTVAYSVSLPDAQGLADKSAVLIKGVRVGRVTALDLEGPGVLAHLQLDHPVTLHQGTQARVSSVGLLGEKQLEILPGPQNAPVLEPGSTIPGRTMPSLDTVIASLAAISTDVQSVTDALKNAMGGPQGEQRIGELVDHISGIAAQVETAIANNQDEIKATVHDVRDVTRTLAQLTDELQRISNKQGPLGEGMDNALKTTESLRRTAEHLEEITARIERGEGTVGRLLVKEDIADHVDDAAQSVDNAAKGFLGTTERIKSTRIDFGLRADYLAAHNEAKTYITLDVLPPGKAFAHLELVGEPAVAVGSKATPAPPPAAGDSAGQGFASGPLTFTAMAGYRFIEPLDVRLGLLESRPGAGVDVLLFKDHLKLTADVWDFGRSALWPHARLQAGYRLIPQLELIAGWDEALNVGKDIDSFFAGAAFRLEVGGK